MEAELARLYEEGDLKVRFHLSAGSENMLTGAIARLRILFDLCNRSLVSVYNASRLTTLAVGSCWSNHAVSS